jgi:hypothetical protein
LAPLTIVELTSSPYPPSPGSPLQLRRSERPHNKRTSDIEPRVATPEQSVQELNVVLHTLATPNSVRTSPLAPLPIVALTSMPYLHRRVCPLYPIQISPTIYLACPYLHPPYLPLLLLRAAPSDRITSAPPKCAPTPPFVASPTTPILAPYLAIVHSDMDKISSSHLT